MLMVAAAPGPDGLPPPTASYHLSAALDAERHRIEGRGRMSWHNRSSRPVSELCVHLYLNAFSSPAASWYRGAGEEERWLLRDGGWGSISVDTLSDASGNDLLAALSPIAPQDGNRRDRTLARLTLAEPISPGERLDLEVEFTSRLPRAVSRTGYHDDYHLVAQWFPKLGVIAPDGTWRCRQFLYDGEFFADFGHYEIDLTVPREMVVGATGQRWERRDNGDGTATHRYRAEGVHDFAWTAWPRFVERRLAVERTGLPPVAVRLLLTPESAYLAPRYFDALATSIERFGAWFGPYPYPGLTMVDPPWGAHATGGMEYPTFITTGGGLSSPLAALDPEEVTVHEFAHQYFYGLLASDELGEAFLDEGVTTWATGKLLASAYGPQAWSFSFWGIERAFPALAREQIADTSTRYFRYATIDPVARSSWGYLDRRTYGAMTYSKMALALEQAERTVGAEAMEGAMRAYAQRYRFRHPTTADLLTTLDRETGHDLSPLWRQALFGSAVLDYAVADVSTRPRRRAIGVAGADAETTEEAVRGFESEVVVRRLGDFRTPVVTELVFADGRRRRVSWDGEERWVRYRVHGPALVSAEADPDEVLVLDVDRLNNSLLVDPDRRASRRWGQRLRFWIQNLLETAAALG